jgi:hypothetical protein
MSIIIKINRIGAYPTIPNLPAQYLTSQLSFNELVWNNQSQHNVYKEIVK